ncbi:hypothetical protein [Pseudoxanthomonas putridarboris]|uniref:Uncharacterized protein n=1 Tax=Pseudoxanthomonas putridarboris TaxID=752605 RepID=A0ABU9IWF4_9GAMM
MDINYRCYARQALQQARVELQGEDDVRLRSAALQLRMSMEALTYDRMRAYAFEVPPHQYATWQPKKVMQLLLEIDAKADADSSVAVGLEKTYGVAPPMEEMKSLGSEKVLNLATIKRHYDALGSYLHIPTLKQMRQGDFFDASKLRARCLQIVTYLDEVLASPVWNIRLTAVSKTDCIYCGKPMQRRCPKDGETVAVSCFECGALYRLVLVGAQQVRWDPMQTRVKCLTGGCDHSFVLGNHEIKRGSSWTCKSCSQRYMIDYAVLPDSSPSMDASGG